MGLADWGRYLVQGASSLRLTDAPQLFPMVETLHEFYAFWWWIDPHFLPCQPWPQKRSDRRRWLQHWLSYHVHREDFPEDLPLFTPERHGSVGKKAAPELETQHSHRRKIWVKIRELLEGLRDRRDLSDG